MLSISVITPTFNSARTLVRTLESVAAQGVAGYEHIVVDGDSTDGTAEVVARFPGVRFVTEQPRGPYAAMNTGIRLAGGGIVAILNSDDWYEPGTLRTVLETFDATPSVDGVYGNVRFWRGNGENEILVPRRLITADLVKGMPLFHPALFLRARVHASIGLYDERYRICADYDFVLRAIRVGCTFRHVDKVLANMSDGGISAVNRLPSARESFLCKTRNGLSRPWAFYHFTKKLAGGLFQRPRAHT